MYKMKTEKGKIRGPDSQVLRTAAWVLLDSIFSTPFKQTKRTSINTVAFQLKVL